MIMTAKKMSDRGLLALARHEGIVPAPYLDVRQVWTFGVGHTAAAGAPDPARPPRGMPADLDAKVAIANCQDGNYAAGIPVLQQKLRDARVAVPPPPTG